PVEDDAWIACLEANPDCHLDSDLERSPLISFLTPREREAVLRRNESNLPPEAKPHDEKPPRPPKESELRLVTGLPKGVVRDLFKLEGCGSNAKSRNFSYAIMDFRADGLPRYVEVQATPSRVSCRRAAESLFLMALAPADEYVPPTRQIAYVAPLSPNEMLCNEGSSPAPGSRAEAAPNVVRIRADVVPPQLIKKVKPFYPEAARQNREQGVSIYQAIITSTGCIRDLKLLRSSTQLLDVSGILAISQWRYRPATLDARPVNVYLTVTVTFRLTPR
ncbi:MAG: energy transducer TonB, partial [Rubrobacteraceae bacterium]